MKFVGADAYLDSQVPRLAPLVQAAAGLPLSEADALKVSKALLLGFGEETGLCFIDLRRCFGELAKNFGCDGAHRTLSAMMANDKLRLALFNYGSVQAQGLPGMSWKHVRILWPLEEIQQNVRVRPVDGKHPARTESCDAFIVFAARAIEGVADQLDGADDLDAQDVATRLADCFVSVTHEGSRAAVLDLARLERTPYNVVRVVAARKSTGLAGLMQGHARQLGGIAYTVRWADHRNREDFFPNPWPLRARFTCFRPSAEEREDMASRVQTILGVSADKACIVSEKLLEGFGSVETDDKFPRSLCCIDLRPMPAFLESQFGREGRQMMVKLTDHSPKLVGDPSSRSWSNAFGDVRLILPG